jgi:UDP-2,3-diacylglucosamine hydrolase
LKEQILIVSDLHLSSDDECKTKLFIKFCQTQNPQKLFILGDLFNVWLGDEVSLPLFPKLFKTLNNLNYPVFIMRGNRDFLLNLNNQKNISLIKEPYLLNNFLLLHGDSLCTDDIKYQRFKKIIQHPITKKIFLLLPIKTRFKISEKLRNTSTKATQQKHNNIMDVNLDTIDKLMQKYPTVDLIHGHTHRQNIHQHKGFKRFVLGDWSDVEGNALKIENNTCAFLKIT